MNLDDHFQKIPQADLSEKEHLVRQNSRIEALEVSSFYVLLNYLAAKAPSLESIKPTLVKCGFADYQSFRCLNARILLIQVFFYILDNCNSKTLATVKKFLSPLLLSTNAGRVGLEARQTDRPQATLHKSGVIATKGES